MKRISDPVSVVIPLYNNSVTLKKQLSRLIRSLSAVVSTYQILICDDRSTDRSLELLQAFKRKDRHIDLLIHSKNLGIAPTLRELYEKARYEYIVLFSLDGDWEADDVARLIRSRHRTGADMVVGIRDKTVYSPYRRFVSVMYDKLTQLLYAVDTMDAGSIKIFRKKLFRELHIQSRSIFIEAELIVKAKSFGYNIQAIPITFHKKVRGSGAGGNLLNIVSSFTDLLLIRLTFRPKHEQNYSVSVDR